MTGQEWILTARVGSDVVDGRYDLESPAGKRPAAVRITDMVREAILIVEERIN